MVRLTIKIRPRNGYSYPQKIRTVAVDSSQRLEQLITDLKLDKKGLALYDSVTGRELPLNSSFASHNVRTGDTLETCSSPLLSAVLSAVLNDLNVVQNLPEQERVPQRVKQLLDGVTLDPWPDRWSRDDVKRRIICLATMKKVLQRMDRYADLDVPPCRNVHELHKFMQSVWSNNNGRNNSNLAHCFKPSATNRGGKPSICWELLQQKLDNFYQLAASQASDDNLIEAFVETENKRHSSKQNRETGFLAGDNGNDSSSIAMESSSDDLPLRPRRVLATISRQQQQECATCKISPADCMCLDASCAFHKQLSCVGCFSANHPLLVRNHLPVPLTDKRAKAVIKQANKQYIPQYASGAFSCLCALYEAMEESNDNATGGRGAMLSLSESRLKELAQPFCRSNLYDRQAKQQNAFACMESMAEKHLVRKELIPGAEEARYSLLPDGELLARSCLVF